MQSVSKQRIPSLDGLRAISITLVCIGHLGHGWPSLKPFETYALLGVQIFFVISGFLITTLLLTEHSRTGSVDLRQFYIRRAFRILPAAAVFMLFAFTFYWHEMRWYNMVAALLYVVNFDYHRSWVLGHLWSLGVEEQFYLLWPGVLKRWYRETIAILLFTIAFAPLFRAVCYHFKVPGGGFGMFPAVADTLAIGCLVAILSPRIPKIPGWAAFAMLVPILLVPQFAANSPARTLFSLFVLSPILQFSIAGVMYHVIQNPYRFLNVRPVVWLGWISYSLYLWQQPFFFAKPQNHPYGLILAVGLACCSYYLVEQPMLRLRQTLTRPSPIKKIVQRDAA